MSNLTTLLKDIIHSFGKYLNKHPNVKEFPEQLITEYRERFHSFWTDNFQDEINKWCGSGLKGLFFGSVVGGDLALYVYRFGAIFDKLILREPLSKVLFLAPYKTSRGFYEEMIGYLGVIMALEPWIEKEIVYLHPPFYLMDDKMRTTILRTIECYYTDEVFREVALTCPDRKFGRKKMIETYQEIFTRVFNPYYIDLNGGIHLFTQEYIIRAMAQDIVTAIILAQKIGAIPVTCLERHARLLYCVDNAKMRERISVDIPSGLGKYDAYVIRNRDNFSQFRRHLKSLLFEEERKEGSDKLVEELSISLPKISKERAFLYNISSPDLVERDMKYLKLPFESAYNWKNSG